MSDIYYGHIQNNGSIFCISLRIYHYVTRVTNDFVVHTPCLRPNRKLIFMAVGTGGPGGAWPPPPLFREVEKNSMVKMHMNDANGV